MSLHIKTGLPLILSLIVVPLLCCGALLCIPVLVHNIQLNKFAQNLYRYPLPPLSEVVDRQSEVSLMGNGNHCDFLAEQVMTTQLTRQEIESYYRDIEFPGISAESSKVFVDVRFADDFSVNEMLSFTVSILDFGNPTNLDLRCH